MKDGDVISFNGQISYDELTDLCEKREAEINALNGVASPDYLSGIRDGIFILASYLRERARGMEE